MQPLEDPQASGLDAIARELAEGQISRRTALRRFAGISLAAMVPGGLFAESALARCPKSRRCHGTCCPKHAHCNRHHKCKCDAGYTKCGKHCRDLETDERNCGSCGHRCPDGTTCRHGHCRPATAQACFTDTDCPDMSAECQTATCVSGSCQYASDPSIGQPCHDSGVGACRGSGTFICDGAGAVICNITTPGSTPQTEICGNGIDDDCDGVVDNGCPGHGCSAGGDCQSNLCCSGVCVDGATDANNCGGCGNVCQNGRTCVNGTCGVACASDANCASAADGHHCLTYGFCGCRPGFSDCPGAKTCVAFVTDSSQGMCI